MTNQEKLTTEDSIAIIEQSLKQSSSQKTGASNYYIIWGLVLFAFLMGNFMAFHFPNDMTKSIANALPNLFAVGGLLSFLQSRKDNKVETVVPLNEKIYMYSWIAASIGLGVICIVNLRNMPEGYCLGILLIFGLVNFIIGGVTKFKPLLIGGAISMILAAFIPILTMDYKFLITAIGVLSSCLVPGLIMKYTKSIV
jgi:hypothetical protein